MFGWLRSRKPALPEKLYFKDSNAAFEYAAQYMSRGLAPVNGVPDGRPGQFLIGIIDGMAPPHPLLRTKTIDKYAARLAVTGGVVAVENCGSIAAGGNLRQGDLVAVQVGSYDPRYPPDHPMNYFVAICRLKPTLIVADNYFEIDEQSIPKRG